MSHAGKRRTLARNQLGTMPWKHPEVAEKVDRRVVTNPRQVSELLTVLSTSAAVTETAVVAWSRCSQPCTDAISA